VSASERHRCDGVARDLRRLRKHLFSVLSALMLWLVFDGQRRGDDCGGSKSHSRGAGTQQQRVSRGDASSVLCVRPTSPARSSSASSYLLSRCVPQDRLLRENSGSPGSRPGRFGACAGSTTAPGRAMPRASGIDRVAFRTGSRRRHPGLLLFTAQCPARTCPCQRFAHALTSAHA
jgi:hypothetical protein